MIIRCIIFFFLLNTSVLRGSIQEYLKPAVNKAGYHQMPNVDFIYMINLDERPEKFRFCSEQLEPYGIYPYRFSAINGWKLPIDIFNNLGVKFEPWMDSRIWATCYLPEDNGEPHHDLVMQVGRTYFCHCMSKGAVAICLSHLSVLQDAYNSGYETIWVMEDDIHVVTPPHTLSALINKLDNTIGKENWDILFTDPDIKDLKGNYVPCFSFAPRPDFSPHNPGRFAERTRVDRDFIKVGARYGAHSMIVRRSGMKKILDFINKYNLFAPYDMDFCMPNDIKLYSLQYDVVTNYPGSPSDNGGANYKH